MSRPAALRLFQATQADLRAADRLSALGAALPWRIEPATFVATAHAARAALKDACALFARLAAIARPTQRGGLAVLQVDRASPASAAEVAELSETARKFNHMSGLRRLLALL